MTQSPQERRRAQRRLSRQVHSGNYEPSSIGRRAREAASSARGQEPPATPQEAAAILRGHQADDAWYLAEQQMAGSPVDVYGPPVKSINPKDPRIAMMEYWRNAQMVKVYWGDGKTPYIFLEIPPALWTQWKLTASPGRFLNRNLSGKPYMPSPF